MPSKTQFEDDTDRVREILEKTHDNVVFTVNEEVVWVSGMNANCDSLARQMARELAYEHDIPTGLTHDDDAAKFGGIQFRWGNAA